MEERTNKPRVFLSHSKKNVDFIEKLATDLAKCQIDPWLDTDQIRHGKSWQDSIFESGIPTCDAIIVYFTEMSIQSVVVKKEMDVGLLQSIKDNHIAFLPYVSNENLRNQLRADIQALQVPEWNDTNYSVLLPRVVAEIWRSYLERTIDLAVKSERLRRVELELELEKRRNQPDEVFSTSENKEFEFVFETFNTRAFPEIGIQTHDYGEYKDIEDAVIGQYVFRLDMSSVVARLGDYFSSDYNSHELHRKLFETLASCDVISEIDQRIFQYTVKNFPAMKEFTNDLLTHGLIERYNYTSYIQGSEYLESKMLLSKKYYRYRFWLAYHQRLPNQFVYEFVQKR